MVLRALNLYVMIKFYFISYFHVYVFFFHARTFMELLLALDMVQMCESRPPFTVILGFFIHPLLQHEDKKQRIFHNLKSVVPVMWH